MRISAAIRRRRRVGLGPAAVAALAVGTLAAWRLRRARRAELPPPRREGAPPTGAAPSTPPAVHARHAAPAPSHPRPGHDPGPAASGAGDPPAGEETLSEAEIVALRAELRAELDRLRGTMAPRARRRRRTATVTDGARRFIRRRESAVEVIDQRALPTAERWLTLATPGETAAAIKKLAIRGAPAIGIAAAHAIALAAREGPKSARHAAQLLAAARPTAVNLSWACERMTAALERALAEGRDPARALAAEADAIAEEQRRADRAIATHGASLVPDGARVLTICNTGALATGGEGTALAIALEAHRQGRVREVLALETRPLLQGARLTCWELERAGVPHRLLCDSAAGAAFASGLVDCVLVGADRIARNGDVANKIGTYPLAVLAERHDAPFYVAAPTSTIDPATASGAEIPIEQRPEEEVLGFGAVATAPHGTRAWNPAFDVTPAALVAAIVCERGIARAPYDRSLAALVGGTAREQLSRAGAGR